MVATINTRTRSGYFLPLFAIALAAGANGCRGCQGPEGGVDAEVEEAAADAGLEQDAAEDVAIDAGLDAAEAALPSVVDAGQAKGRCPREMARVGSFCMD